MAMFIWRIEFEYQVNEQEIWLRDLAHHLGDDNGGPAVNYVREKMLGTEVEITAGIGSKIKTQIVDWRLVGLLQVCKLNFIDNEVLAAAGITIENEDNDGQEEITAPDQHDHVENTGSEKTDTSVGCGSCSTCPHVGPGKLEIDGGEESELEPHKRGQYVQAFGGESTKP